MNQKQQPLSDVDGFDAWVAVARACQMCQRALQKALEPLNLEVAHYDVLANVSRDEGLTQKVLARRLLVAKSNVSALLSGLESRELVVRERDEIDARARRIRLTANGRKLVARATKLHAGIIETMMAPVPPAEREIVRAAMLRVSAALQEKEA
jgi:MarR family transcriptional regulator, organic hydroperoxide resistance regulator